MQIRQVKVHESFSIILRAIPSTGYLWTYKEIPGLKLISSKYETERTGTDGMDFGPTIVTFYFEAQEPGEYELRLRHVRPWEKTAAPISSYEEIICAS